MGGAMSSRSSTSEPLRRLPDRVRVADVRRVHGIKGAVLVEVHSDNPERFAAGSPLVAVTGDGLERHLVVQRAAPHGAGLLVSFEGVEDRDAAESLRGASLEADRGTVPPAPEGTYYFFELVGCRCFDGDEELGRVEEVLEDGGGVLLVVASGERRIPIPFVERFVQRVDVAEGKIELELPAGLVDTCASTS